MHSQRAARRRGRGIGDQHSLVVGNAAASDVGKAVDRGRSRYEIYRPLLGQQRAGRYGPYRGQGSGAGIVQLHVLTGGEVRQRGLTLIMHSEGNPIGNLLRFLILGEGDVAPIAHEVLRRAIRDPNHRPVIHVS